MGVGARRQARIGDPLDVVATGEERGDGGAFATCRATRRWSVRSPRRTRKQSNGPGTPPIAFWRKWSRSAIGRIARHRDAEDRVAVAGEVLRRRVEHDVRAEIERALEGRRGERVVDDEERALGPAGEPLGDRRAAAAMSTTFRSGFVGVSNQTSRVSLGQRLPERVGVAGQVRVPRVDTGRTADPLEVAVRAAVDVVADDDLGPGRRRARRWRRSRPSRTRTRSPRRRPRARLRPARAGRGSG